jgi:hypothetical protein
MEPQGLKHLVRCKCILPHLKGSKEPVFHSFVAFSVIDENDKVVEKNSQCNNCGIVHRVFGVCESEILSKESSLSVITEKDISLLIPTELTGILSSYKCDIATWEMAHFLYSNERWGSTVSLMKEEKRGEIEGKRLVLVSAKKFNVEPFAYTEMA